MSWAEEAKKTGVVDIDANELHAASKTAMNIIKTSAAQSMDIVRDAYNKSKNKLILDVQNQFNSVRISDFKNKNGFITWIK